MHGSNDSGELRPDVQNQYNSEILYYLKEEGEKEKEKEKERGTERSRCVRGSFSAVLQIFLNLLSLLQRQSGPVLALPERAGKCGHVHSFFWIE